MSSIYSEDSTMSAFTGQKRALKMAAQDGANVSHACSVRSWEPFAGVRRTCCICLRGKTFFLIKFCGKND